LLRLYKDFLSNHHGYAQLALGAFSSYDTAVFKGLPSLLVLRPFSLSHPTARPPSERGGGALMETSLCLFLSVQTFFSLSARSRRSGLPSWRTDRWLHWLLKVPILEKISKLILIINKWLTLEVSTLKNKNEQNIINGHRGSWQLISNPVLSAPPLRSYSYGMRRHDARTSAWWQQRQGL